MVVDSYARSAEASRIVQARLPICAARSYSVRYSLWRDLGTRPSLADNRWSFREMAVAFARYSRDDGFQALITNKVFVVAMTAGSIAGTIIGGLLLGVVPGTVLIPLLVALLIASSIKVWRHR
jgi:hypothetical protein